MKTYLGSDKLGSRTLGSRTLGSQTLHSMNKAVVALGVFDGVHRGHQQIFKQLRRAAQKTGGVSVVYTFDPHPARIVAPEAAPPMINTLEQKLALIAAQGIAVTVVEPFTKAYARQTPEEFFHRIIVARIKPVSIIVGHDFTFGVHRSGTLTLLKELASAHGIAVKVVAPYLWKETIVSSTQIRQRLAAGQLEKARELLSRPYFSEGIVVRGHGVGGPLGLHTANLHSENDRILPTGVYITITHALGKKYRSVTNIGNNPTFGTNPVSIETHLLHFDRSLLKKKIRIEWLKKIREEIKFPSPAELVVQIHHDIDTAQKYLNKRRIA